MFSAEKWFCKAMKTLWPTGVNCIVGFPDERWEQEIAYPKACVFTDELELVSKAGDKSTERVVDGDPADTEYRCIGEGDMVLEVRIATDNSEKELNDLTLQFLEEFVQGFTFGPTENTDRFQITETVVSRKVRGPEGGSRLTERLFRIPVSGPLEESSSKYEVETTEFDDDIEATD